MSDKTSPPRAGPRRWLDAIKEGYLSECEAENKRLYAENERLRAWLKHLKGLAQDEDNLAFMDEIDKALGSD